MYTMVLMMAVTSGGDVASFGHRNKGCNGDQVACHGSMAAHGYAGCTGTVASGYGNGCTGADAGCHGGGKGGFLGLRGKLFGGRKKSSSCNGADASNGSCYGSMHQGGAYGGGTGCTGGVIHMPPAPPVIMPKTEDPKIKPKTESN